MKGEIFTDAMTETNAVVIGSQPNRVHVTLHQSPIGRW